MKQYFKKFHIGRRTLKTAAAVLISMLIVSAYGVSTSKMLFAMMGAMAAMETSFKKSVESCLAQIIGMIFGAIVGVLLRMLPLNSLVIACIGIVLVITLYNAMQIRFSPVLPCMIVVMICTTDIRPFTYAVGRLWDTAIGLVVGMIINVLVFPYDNSTKIRDSIEYLEVEVIEFLEDMFDGDMDFPNTEKMTKTINDLVAQLGIFKKQWVPMHKEQKYERLEIFRKCEIDARQLVSHMEVLCRMDSLGRLNDENRKLLTESGAKIKDDRKVDEVKDFDIITNYHVAQILKLRQELIENLRELHI